VINICFVQITILHLQINLFLEVNHEKLFFIIFLVANFLIFSANVYFDYPVNNFHYQIDINGRVGVNYHIRTVSSFSSFMIMDMQHEFSIPTVLGVLTK